MKFRNLHSWDLPPADAVALQRQLADRVDCSTPLTSFKTIAGADISYNRYSPVLYVCVVVLKLPELTIVEEKTATVRAAFPYRTGLLSFREGPALIEVFRKLRRRPDVVMIDGQGRAHPRRLGIASHMGLWLDVPCVGCAKSRLVGTYDEPAREAGSVSALLCGNERVGSMVRTKNNVKPLFVSVGHRIDLSSAERVVRVTTRCHRIPEPTRLAHERVNAYRRRSLASSEA